MNNMEIISGWINDQLKKGKTDDELDGKAFYDGNDLYVMKKTRKKGIFDLKCRFGGVINLDELKE
ncbi:hypothetical protein [Paenibacillus pini]|uniref:Uncharacterized protein n=1 Tax=Paenibacillus pini JCM 16418 TaxID=1236976 RepID=W7YQT8_9BACL|nr:hypothetical protein [Paenibacillus pini]GAF10922.1 hypothetical protein JCM16418_5159 [Paenibacillus pini JCM 16418]